MPKQPQKGLRIYAVPVCECAQMDGARCDRDRLICSLLHSTMYRSR